MLIKHAFTQPCRSDPISLNYKRFELWERSQRVAFSGEHDWGPFTSLNWAKAGRRTGDTCLTPQNTRDPWSYTPVSILAVSCKACGLLMCLDRLVWRRIVDIFKCVKGTELLAKEKGMLVAPSMWLACRWLKPVSESSLCVTKLGCRWRTALLLRWAT